MVVYSFKVIKMNPDWNCGQLMIPLTTQRLHLKNPDHFFGDLNPLKYRALWQKTVCNFGVKVWVLEICSLWVVKLTTELPSHQLWAELKQFDAYFDFFGWIVVFFCVFLGGVRPSTALLKFKVVKWDQMDAIHSFSTSHIRLGRSGLGVIGHELHEQSSREEAVQNGPKSGHTSTRG